MKESKATIIGFICDPERICASAARIPTTKGGAEEIFLQSERNEKNSALIGKVLAMGHESFIEHAVFTIAFSGVSAVVEQFLIEFRLASFTVKSRRYVDFSDMGYVVPQGLDKDEERDYRAHMEQLFLGYSCLIDEGVPKEDARFVLPYAFRSNLYCTMNARELLRLVSAMRSPARGSNEELRGLAEQIVCQIGEVAPFLVDWLMRPDEEKGGAVPLFGHLDESAQFVEHKCQLVQATDNPSEVLRVACSVLGESFVLEDQLSSEDAAGFFPSELLTSFRSRELEQISASFLIKEISLSALTHLARHRMQSLVVPSLFRAHADRYVIPETIERDAVLAQRYRDLAQSSCDMFRKAESSGQVDARYFLLSGNTIDVMTTMNARELLHFFKLRCCMRAQWEIREVAWDMLSQLRKKSPFLYSGFGPSCYVERCCPEGRQSCGMVLRRC